VHAAGLASVNIDPHHTTRPPNPPPAHPQAILSQHRHKFSGVLNGIDHESWCPESDPYLGAHFSAADPLGKETCKRMLLEELGLPYTQPAWVNHHQQQPPPPQPSANGNGNGAAVAAQVQQPPAELGRPLLAVVSRLTVQKGLPLILHGIKTAIARGAQVRVGSSGWLGLVGDWFICFGVECCCSMSSIHPSIHPSTHQVVVLGTASEPEVQRQWEEMARQYGRGGDARLVLRYDEGLSHRIYAGADMILVRHAWLVGGWDGS